MELNELKDRLRAIVNKAARSLTDDDKSFLLWAGEQYGLQRGGKSGCVKCWHDYAMQIWQRANEEQEQEQEQDARAYILRKGVDVYFGTIRVNEATLTDDLARKIIARGFERKFFAKCE